jgi:hypothetical protein
MAIALSIASLLGLGYAKPIQANARTLAPELESKALQYIAEQQGIAMNQLSIATATSAQLSLSGLVLDEFKFITTDGRMFSVSFDATTRQVVDATALFAQEQKLRQAKYGVLEPGLYNRIQGNAAERIPVAIWVAMEDPGTSARNENRNLQALAERVRAAQTPVADSAKGLGAIISQANLVPVIFAELNAGQINALSRHSNVVAIETIPQNIEMHNDDSMTSDRFVFTWSLWPVGTKPGAGAKIAVHEWNGVDDTSPFLIDPVYWCSGVGEGPGGEACTEGKNLNGTAGHATRVASVIASTNSWRRGGAWGLTVGSLLSANFGANNGLLFFISNSGSFVNDLNMSQLTDSLRTEFQKNNITLSQAAVTEVIQDGNQWKIVDAGKTYMINVLNASTLVVNRYVDGITITRNAVNSASWAIENGGDTINMSWGSSPSNESYSFYNRWADYLVKIYGVNIVVSSGNYGDYDVYNIQSPSAAWNTISVGSYSDKDTGGRNDDTFSTFSQWRNPTDPNSEHKYEKPDVVAMGERVELTGGGGVYLSTSGTSFAAPEVSALTALVISKEPNLRRKPETMKAIIMAGATHNIVDGVNYLDCPSSPSPADCRDGAGAIDAFQTINNIVVPGNWKYYPSISPGTSFDTSGNIDIPVSLSQGKDARVVIAWSSTAVCSSLGAGSQSCASDVLNADLDLIVLGPDKKVVANASSKQNSAEVVDFKPAVNGTYTIQIRKTRFDANTNTNLGVAWNTDTADMFSNSQAGAIDFPLNTTVTNQTTNMGQSFWDSYGQTTASYCPVAGREIGPEKVYRVTTSSPGSIRAYISNIGYLLKTVSLQSLLSSSINVLILNQNGAFVACSPLGTSALSLYLGAGTYFIVVDGAYGSVGNFDLKVDFVPAFLPTPTLRPSP